MYTHTYTLTQIHMLLYYQHGGWFGTQEDERILLYMYILRSYICIVAEWLKKKKTSDFLHTVPSGNQTWQWNMDNLSVTFPIKPAFTGDFPASHV